MNPLIILGLFSLIGKNKNIQLLILGLIFYFLVIWKSPTDYFKDWIDKLIITDNEINQLENDSKIYIYFSQSWYLDRARDRDINFSNLINSDIAENYCTDIYDAKDFFDDDEQDLYNIFDAIPNKLSLGYISHLFVNRYNIGLLEYLKSFLSNKELVKIYDIVQRKSLS